MRSAIALLVLAVAACHGLALEKKVQHATLPKLHVVEDSVPALEESLDEVHPALEEESAAEEAQPALEEEEEEENSVPEDQQGLEEEEPAQENSVAEDDNKGLEEDEDNENTVEEQNGLEEEDEEEDQHKIASKKVAQDVDRMLEAVEDSDLSASSKAEAKENLKAIAKDSKEILTASASRAADLKKAIGLRMKALKIMLNPEDDNSKELEEEDEEEEKQQKLNKVEGDISSLEEQIATSALSKSAKKEARSNLEHIKSDAEAIVSSTDAQATSLFKEAIQKRMQALHQMLEEKDTAVDASNVISDVHHLEEALKSSDLPKAAKKEAKKNLEAILKDAKSLPTASAARKEKLTKAMKLRTKALKLQLEEH